MCLCLCMRVHACVHVCLCMCMHVYMCVLLVQVCVCACAYMNAWVLGSSTLSPVIQDCSLATQGFSVAFVPLHFIQRFTEIAFSPPEAVLLKCEDVSIATARLLPCALCQAWWPLQAEAGSLKDGLQPGDGRIRGGAQVHKGVCSCLSSALEVESGQSRLQGEPALAVGQESCTL